jgi:hypothetical protein
MIGKFRLEMGQTCNLGVGNKCIENFGLHVAWKAATWKSEEKNWKIDCENGRTDISSVEHLGFLLRAVVL